MNSEAVYVTGSRVSITKKEFESRSEVYEEGTVMAQCGLWHRMEKKIIAVQNGEQKEHDEINDTKMRHARDNRAFVWSQGTRVWRDRKRAK